MSMAKPRSLSSYFAISKKTYDMKRKKHYHFGFQK